MAPREDGRCAPILHGENLRAWPPQTLGGEWSTCEQQDGRVGAWRVSSKLPDAVRNNNDGVER